LDNTQIESEDAKGGVSFFSFLSVSILSFQDSLITKAISKREQGACFIKLS